MCCMEGLYQLKTYISALTRESVFQILHTVLVLPAGDILGIDEMGYRFFLQMVMEILALTGQPTV